jgi:hypothetical protein
MMEMIKLLYHHGRCLTDYHQLWRRFIPTEQDLIARLSSYYFGR